LNFRARTGTNRDLDSGISGVTEELLGDAMQTNIITAAARTAKKV
jgi:hypothetical protein